MGRCSNNSQCRGRSGSGAKEGDHSCARGRVSCSTFRCCSVLTDLCRIVSKSIGLGYTRAQCALLLALPTSADLSLSLQDRVQLRWSRCLLPCARAPYRRRLEPVRALSDPTSRNRQSAFAPPDGDGRRRSPPAPSRPSLPRPPRRRTRTHSPHLPPLRQLPSPPRRRAILEARTRSLLPTPPSRATMARFPPLNRLPNHQVPN